MKNNRRGTFDDITNEINETKESTFYSKTVRSKLFYIGYNRRAQKKKMVVRVCNSKKASFLVWSKGNWTIYNQWKN